ncbi:hypothetical protein Droror1_Dr00028277, partial [Drosera rotundifolia]
SHGPFLQPEINKKSAWAASTRQEAFRAQNSSTNSRSSSFPNNILKTCPLQPLPFFDLSITLPSTQNFQIEVRSHLVLIHQSTAAVDLTEQRHELRPGVMSCGLVSRCVWVAIPVSHHWFIKS